ncbi:MAG TPA: hypothetical protein VK631_07650 [Solirubrobacteraceae bacterium]|nr:hypothetical protein [Solirubrobacteraceae bacterium]
MRVEQSQQTGVVKAQSGLAGAAEAAPKTAFAGVLAASTSDGGADKAERALPKGPKGETTSAVKDHPAYIEVMSGPRNGMFINTTNNERRGEAFVLVRRDDRDLHIYGTGKDRRVIISWHKDQPAHDADATPPKTGGATAPTAGA